MGYKHTIQTRGDILQSISAAVKEQLGEKQRPTRVEADIRLKESLVYYRELNLRDWRKGRSSDILYCRPTTEFWNAWNNNRPTVEFHLLRVQKRKGQWIVSLYYPDAIPYLIGDNNAI